MEVQFYYISLQGTENKVRIIEVRIIEVRIIEILLYNDSLPSKISVPPSRITHLPNIGDLWRLYLGLGLGLDIKLSP